MITHPGTSPKQSSEIIHNIHTIPTLAFHEFFSVFSLLRSEQNNADKTEEKKYPWIARVVHSTDKDYPYLCTAACIEDRIFVTAARCIYQAKLSLTTVINQGARLRPIAFVVPSKPTKQMFDDIGFIVVKKTNHKWKTVKVFDKQDNKKFTRTDKNYFWLSKMGEIKGTAVGFVNKTFYKRNQDILVITISCHVSIHAILCRGMTGANVANGSLEKDTL
ncbi:uncharacterized protein LOC134751708 [Cydia strobilella]|uniref:uncharacterized protein LOC134751708 n=1 Tax=Cydia strobilella TaxID=1100964 RepID=UPI0030060E74